jgi:hypothetical protein
LKTDLFNQLPVTGGYRISPIDRHPARARARDCAYTPKPGNQPVTSNFREPAVNGRPEGMDPQTHTPPTATVLRHCRCMDCRRFSKVGGEYFCSEYIGGTSVIWATGKRECDPPPDAWHYCSHYNGPQISKDVWVWPRSLPGQAPENNIAREEDNPGDGPTPSRRLGAYTDISAVLTDSLEPQCEGKDVPAGTRSTNKKWPAPGGGRPGGGPNSSRLAGGEPAESESDSSTCEEEAKANVTSGYQRSTVDQSPETSIAREKDTPGDAPTRTKRSGTSVNVSAISTHRLDPHRDAPAPPAASAPPSHHVPPGSTIAPEAAQGYDSARQPLLMERCTD